MMRLKKPTKKQLEALIRIYPGPIGQGMKQKEAAKDLGISLSAFKYRLRSFKRNFPNGYKRFMDLIKLSRKQRINLREHLRVIPPFEADRLCVPLNWLEEESNSDKPSDSAKEFGLIKDWF